MVETFPDPEYEEARLRFATKLVARGLVAPTDAELVSLIDEYEDARRIDRDRLGVTPTLLVDGRHREIFALAASGEARTADRVDPGRAERESPCRPKLKIAKTG